MAETVTIPRWLYDYLWKIGAQKAPNTLGAFSREEYVIEADELELKCPMCSEYTWKAPCTATHCPMRRPNDPS